VFKSKPLTYILFLTVSIVAAWILFLANNAEQEVQTNLSIRNNLWSHYNSKSLKSKLFEIEKNRLVLSGQLSGQDLTKNVLLNSLAGNLDREITRYRKEQTDIQAEAVRRDNSFELSKRRKATYDLAALLAAVSISSFIGALILAVDSLFAKVATFGLTLVAMVLACYGFWLV
jgi:hypothetical protein